jgi:hypothetical protein
MSVASAIIAVSTNERGIKCLLSKPIVKSAISLVAILIPMMSNLQERPLAGSVFLRLVIIAMVRALLAGYLPTEILILIFASVTHFA